MRAAIKGLNEGSVKVADLTGNDSHFFGKLLYLCQKKGERIENPTKFFQVKELASKKKAEDLQQTPDAAKAIDFISRVNSGEQVEIHLLSYLELESIFNVLWGNSGFRINSKYKDVYFELRDRYPF